MRSNAYDREGMANLRKRNYSSVNTAVGEENATSSKERTYGNGTTIFRLFLFLIHFGTSIALVSFLYNREGEKCSRRNFWFTSNREIMRTELQKNHAITEVIPVLTEYESHTCSVPDPDLGECYDKAVNSIGVRYGTSSWTMGGSVHVIALMTIFEYFTASYALVYFSMCFNNGMLGLTSRTIRNLCLVVAQIWNLIFSIVIWVRPSALPMTHILLALVGLVVTSWVQMQYVKMKEEDNGKLKYDFYVRYYEYSLTAPILFISILTISTMSGITATTLQVSFLGMIACNLLGVVIHGFYEDVKENVEDSQVKCFYALLFSWWAWLASWLPYFIIFSGLMGAISEIPDQGVRTGVSAVVVILLIFYLLFGVIPSFSLYLIRIFSPSTDTEVAEDIMVKYVFDILSFVVKFVAVVIVTFSDFFQPREACP